jgi:peptide/nickel transport system substrate-binding protein
MGWYTPSVEWAYNDNARVPPFDIEEARGLLEDAGYGGQRLHLSLLVPDASPIRELGEAVAKQIRRIGPEVTVSAVPVGDFPTRLTSTRDFDIAILTGGQGPDPDALRERFAATGDGDYIGYASTEFRRALDDGARATDLATRARAYFRAQDIMARDVPVIPLTESVRLVVVNRRIHGLPQLEAEGLVTGLDFSLVRMAETVEDTR